MIQRTRRRTSAGMALIGAAAASGWLFFGATQKAPQGERAVAHASAPPGAHGHGDHAHGTEASTAGAKRGSKQNVTGYAHATWIRPESVKVMRKMASTVVYGEAVSSRRGPDAGPARPAPTERSIPTQRVRFRLLRTLSGTSPEPEFTVTY